MRCMNACRRAGRDQLPRRQWWRPLMPAQQWLQNGRRGTLSQYTHIHPTYTHIHPNNTMMKSQYTIPQIEKLHGLLCEQCDIVGEVLDDIEAGDMSPFDAAREIDDILAAIEDFPNTL